MFYSKNTDGSSTQTNCRQILYCRLPGLLAFVARKQRRSEEKLSPLIVSEGRLVRDACSLAIKHGVHVGASVLQSRRLCPSALVVPLDAISPRKQTITFLDHLADYAAIVEPEGQDAAFAEVTKRTAQEVAALLSTWAKANWGIVPVLGLGVSRVAARACGECHLPASRLAEADITFLWPEDADITGRLKRLGLPTFGDISKLPESLFVHQFGRKGRLLYRRAHGQDLTPIRALYPLPRADAERSLSEFPIEDAARLNAILGVLANEAARQLKEMGRFGRRVILRVSTERDSFSQEKVISAPIQEANDLHKTANQIICTLQITAPVTGIRLIVDDTEVPQALTITLFADKGRDREMLLQATRRTLRDKFGPRALLRLSELPVSLRDERRTLTREAWAGPR